MFNKEYVKKIADTEGKENRLKYFNDVYEKCTEIIIREAKNGNYICSISIESLIPKVVAEDHIFSFKEDIITKLKIDGFNIFKYNSTEDIYIEWK